MVMMAACGRPLMMAQELHFRLRSLAKPGSWRMPKLVSIGLIWQPTLHEGPLLTVERGNTKVAPGVVDTPLHEGISNDFLTTRQALRTMTEVKDIIDAVLYPGTRRSSDGRGNPRGRWFARWPVIAADISISFRSARRRRHRGVHLRFVRKGIFQ